MSPKSKSPSLVEIRPGVTIEVAPKSGPLELLLRRIRQMFIVAFSPRFSPKRDVLKDAAERYAQEKEIQYYKKIASIGLYEMEANGLKKAFEIKPDLKKGARALVVGSGTGREVFALEEAGLSVVGFDFCGPMLEAAKELKEKRNSQVTFTNEVPKEKFDLVLFTYALTNHLTLQKERVELIKQWIPAMKEDGLFFFTGYFKKIHFGDRFYWAWLIIKIRWLFSKPCPYGMTAISHFGWHNDEATPLPFHFYQTGEEVQKELTDAGLKPIVIKAPKDYPYEEYVDLFLATQEGHHAH